MKVVGEKIICLSEKEFAILADACGIHHLFCFDTENGGHTLAEVSQQEYPVIIHSLWRRGLLTAQAEEMEISKDIADIFLCCKRAVFLLCFLRKDGMGRPSSCIYVADDGQFVSAKPGSRKGEYIRMSLHNGEEIADYMAEAELDSDENTGQTLERILINRGDNTELIAEYRAIKQEPGKMILVGKTSGEACIIKNLAEEIKKRILGEEYDFS